MKKIIETIKSNREELISKYSKMKKEIKVLSEGINQARKMKKKMLSRNCDLNEQSLTWR